MNKEASATYNWPVLGVVTLVVAVLVYYGNPAVALLVAMAASLSSNRVLVPEASKIGKLSLQTAIVLLGFRLNVGDLFEISAEYSPIVSGYVVVTLAAGLVLGLILRVPTHASQLMSSGTAICGGTTIASLSPVIGARSEDTGVALALVFILNAVALLVFPLIGQYLQLTQIQFGIWSALAIHDTSSVVATAAIYGDEALKVATTLKLGRTLWLIPLLLVFSVLQRRGGTKLRIPGFIFLFIAASIVGSYVPIPAHLLDIVHFVCKALLVIALFCVGCEINRETLKNLKGRTIAHGVLLWLIVAPSTLGLIVVFL